jgi:hypothetical protein
MSDNEHTSSDAELSTKVFSTDQPFRISRWTGQDWDEIELEGPEAEWKRRLGIWGPYSSRILDLEDLKLIDESGYCADHPWFQPDIIDDDYDDDDDDPEFVFEYEPLQLKQARRAAANGFAIVPCKPVSHRPLVPPRQASTDVATIEQWWKQFPDAVACAVVFNEPAESARSRAKLSYYDDLDDPPPKRWIMKGVLAHGETSNWFGPPGSLKSALMTDLAIHVASNQDWRGYRANERWCGVLYLALERGAQVKRRLSAYKQKRGVASELPIAVKSEIIDLMREDCVDLVIDAVDEVETHFNCCVGLIIVDTISKGIAAGGGDEDRAKDTNVMLANLRRVQEQTGVHIACVGHTGKDEAKGHRGSSAHMGDVDLMVQISGDAVKTATVIKANDQEEGVLTTFKAEIISLGTDEDGDEITTALVSDEMVEGGKQKGSAKGRRLTHSQSRAMELLNRCVNDHGRPAPPSNEFPPNIRVVELKEWRVMCERGGLSSAEKEEDRDRAFRRAKDDLQTMHRITCLDGFVWPVSILDFNDA